MLNYSLGNYASIKETRGDKGRGGEKMRYEGKEYGSE
jgi:hypothetical protein